MPSLAAMAREAKRASKSAPTKVPVSRAPTSSIFKSTEKVADSDIESDTESDSDSDSDAEPPKAVIPITTVNGVSRLNGQNKINEHKTAAPPSSSSEEEDSDESGSSDEDASSSDSSSSNEEESGSEDKDLSEVLTVAAPSLEPTNSAPGNPPHLKSVSSYMPPSGFEPIPSSSTAKSTASHLLGNQDLSGKQVWYITAPSSVPISAVKKVSLQDVQLGKKSLSLNGEDYGFVQDKVEDKGHIKIMIADDRSSTYRPAKRSIDQTLHLQQIVRLPNLVNVSTSTRATVPASKPVRQQPDGLKMRFLPIGHDSRQIKAAGPSQDVDVEMEDVLPTFKQPKTMAELEASSSDGESSSENDEASHRPARLPRAMAAASNGDFHTSSSDSDSSSSSSSSSSESGKEGGSLSKNKRKGLAEDSESSSDQGEDEDVDSESSGSSSDEEQPTPSLKRKRDDLRDPTPRNSLSQPPPLQGRPLKKSKLQHTESAAIIPVAQSNRKANNNGNRRRVNTSKISITPASPESRSLKQFDGRTVGEESQALNPSFTGERWQEDLDPLIKYGNDRRPREINKNDVLVKANPSRTTLQDKTVLKGVHAQSQNRRTATAATMTTNTTTTSSTTPILPPSKKTSAILPPQRKKWGSR